MATFPTNPAPNPLDGTEIVPITQGGVDKRTTTGDIVKLATAVETGYDNTASGLVAGTVQAAIDELAAGGGGGGASIGVQYTSDLDSTADSDPGAGLMKWNNATQASATVLYLDDATADAVSLTGFWSALQSGGFAYLQDAANQDIWQIWSIDTVTTATGYVKFAVTLLAKGADFADAASMLVTLQQGSSGGGMTNPMTTAGDIIYGGASGTPSRLSATTDGYVLTLVSGAPAWAAASGGGGGLTYFAESQDTSPPNGSVYASVLKADGAASNIDVVISPKGNGALLAQKPDGTAAGGNKRGSYATDLQTSRFTNTQVASGAGAVTIGIANTASGTSSTAIGSGNTASGENSFAAGNNNTANNSSAVAIGNGNTAGGGGVSLGRSNSAVAGTAIGDSCNADADRSIAIGDKANTRGVIGAFAQCSRNLGPDVQGVGYVLSCETTDATPTRMTTNGSAGNTNNQVCLISSMSVVLRGIATARQNTTGDTASWEFMVHIKRDAGVSTTAIVGTASVTPISSTSGAATWMLALSADTTNGALAVDFTGEAGKTIKAGSRIIECVHVSG